VTAFNAVSTDTPVATAFALDFERFVGAIFIGNVAVLTSTVVVVVVEVATL